MGLIEKIKVGQYYKGPLETLLKVVVFDENNVTFVVIKDSAVSRDFSLWVKGSFLEVHRESLSHLTFVRLPYIKVYANELVIGDDFEIWEPQPHQSRRVKKFTRLKQYGDNRFGISFTCGENSFSEFIPVGQKVYKILK